MDKLREPQWQPGERRPNTWSVFLLGLLALLALIVLPSLTGLRRSRDVYENLRQMQENYDRGRAVLERLSTGMFLVSITLREFLLDTAPESGRAYRQKLEQYRADIEDAMRELRATIAPAEVETYNRLQAELQRYWSSVLTALTWSDVERRQQGLYFLRQEQRPRRQTILAIAGEIRELNRALYERELDSINKSEEQFRKDLANSLGLAIVLGIVVAGVTVIRIRLLERRDHLRRAEAEKAREDLRHLSARLHHAQEEERRSIARELHDDVGQKLTALRYGFRTLERLHHADDREFHDRLNGLKTLNEQSLLVIRDIAGGLRPSTLDDLGLSAALHQLARNFSRTTDLKISVQTEGEFQNLGDQEKTYLYRIVQESLTNCAKHARAMDVSVKLRGDADAILLEVRDDGIGFRQRTDQAGSGLIGIEERVRELGGTMKIDSEAGQGTRLLVRLPARARKDHEQNPSSAGR
jgi:signal transduction histidine kinase